MRFFKRGKQIKMKEKKAQQLTAQRLIDNDIMWYRSGLFVDIITEIHNLDGLDMSKVARRLHKNYISCWALRSVLVKKGLVRLEHKGRSKILHITKKGKEVAIKINELNELLK